MQTPSVFILTKESYICKGYERLRAGICLIRLFSERPMNGR